MQAPVNNTAPGVDEYFTKRIVVDLGVTTEKNMVVEYMPGVDAGTFIERPRPRYTCTDTGDIRIHYFQPNGAPYYFHGGKDGNRWSKPYYRDRLQVPVIYDNGKTKKYSAPSGSFPRPYFTPEIIHAYRNQIHLPVVVITEGEFKADAGCTHGIPVIGISGIHSFYDADGSKKLDSDIIDVLRVCKVQKLVLLTDADTLTIKYKPDTDLTERPYSFYSAIRNFREAAMYHVANDETLSLTDVYFGHIATKHNPTGKGLDDLLKQFQHDTKRVVFGLNALTFDNEFFTVFNISDGLNKIKEHFGLNAPEKFYTVYSEFLKEQEFIFKKLTYVWHTESQTLMRLKHKDIKKFMRIGCDWFKLVEVPTRYHTIQKPELDEEIKKWKVGEIARDYLKKFPTFLDDIPKYESWCNIPCMGEKYSRIINGCFNIFNPLKYSAKPGSFENTVGFIKHLFGGAGSIKFNADGTYTECCEIGDTFTVALDYLTIQYRHPMQILPVLCLVSPENNTGKTTFLKWLRDIYGSNATIIDNERFKQSFNSHYITKYIIGIDEGFLDVDKKADKERLKKLATDDKQYLEFKGADTQEIDFYGKIIICSNDADNLMKIEEGEIRWFVVRVQPFTEENAALRQTMRTEIPAWLHFLQHREIVHPNVGRAWFAPQHIVTEQLKVVIEKTRNRLDRIVDDFVIDMFTTYNVNAFRIDLKGLADAINKGGYSKYKIDTLDLKHYLKDKKGMQPSAPQVINFPVSIDEHGIVGCDKSRTARCYEFQFADWVALNTGTIPGTQGEPETEPNTGQTELDLKEEETPF